MPTTDACADTPAPPSPLPTVFTVTRRRGEDESSAPDLTFTLKVIPTLGAPLEHRTRPVASLRYNPVTQEVVICSGDVYQPVFVNGARLLSCCEMALTSGCTVEVHAMLPAVPPKAPATPTTPAEDPAVRSSSPLAGGGGSSCSSSARALSIRCPSWLASSDTDQDSRRTSPQLLGLVSDADGEASVAEEILAVKQVSFQGAQGEHGTDPPSALTPRSPSPLLTQTPASGEGGVGLDLHAVAGAARSTPHVAAAPAALQRSTTRQPSLSVLSSSGWAVEMVGPVEPVAAQEGSPELWQPVGASAPWTGADTAPTAQPNVDGAGPDNVTPTAAATAAAAAAAARCAPLNVAALHCGGSDSGSFAPLSVRLATPSVGTAANSPLATAAAKHGGRGASVTVATTASDDLSSQSCCVTFGFAVSPTALCMTGRCGFQEVKLFSPRADSCRRGAGAVGARRQRRLASLVSDTVISESTARALVRGARVDAKAMYASGSAGTAKEAAVRILALFTERFNARQRRLEAFSNREKQILFCQFVECARAVGGAARAGPAILRLQSPLFCLGELQGDWVELWSNTLTHLSPFGSVELLSTPLLFLGCYARSPDMPLAAGERDMSVEVLMTLVALGVASPAAVHLLRGRNELRGAADEAALRERAAEFFGAALANPFVHETNALYASLPIAAVVDTTVFASPSGIPRPVGGRDAGGDSAKEGGAAGGDLFDRLLAGEPLPRGPSGTSADSAAPVAQLDVLTEVGSLVDTLAGRPPRVGSTDPHCSVGEVSASVYTAVSEGGAESPPRADRLRVFLRRYGFVVLLRGCGGGAAGARVSRFGRAVSLSSSDGAGERGPGGGRRCGGALVTGGTVRLVCWPGTGEGEPAASFPLLASQGSSRFAAPASAGSRRPSQRSVQVHYVMGIPMPRGRDRLLNTDFAALLTPSSWAGSTSRLESLATGLAAGHANNEGEVEYG